jgi:hypothetical protein
MLAIFNQMPTGAHFSWQKKGLVQVQCARCEMDAGSPGVFNVDGEVSQWKICAWLVLSCAAEPHQLPTHFRAGTNLVFYPWLTKLLSPPKNFKLLRFASVDPQA